MPVSRPAPEVSAATRARGALVWGSGALHLACAAAVIARPALWPWALGTVAADHLVLTTAGLLPRSALLGPNWTRLPQGAGAQTVALTIDDGPDPEVTPSVLRLLEAHRARATFFCIGERVRRYPQLARELLARGHALENHSEHHHMHFSLLGPRRIADEVARAQASIQEVTGEVAQFFRAPAGLRNLFLEPVLARAHLKLASWTRRGFDTVDRDPGRVLRRLTRNLEGGDILLLHDGHTARTLNGTAVILEVLPRLLEALAARGLATITLRGAIARTGAEPA